MEPWETSFAARKDLNQYNDNAIGLFALALKYGLDDLETVAADSITDGAEDKKCDIVYVNRDEEMAVVCQCYFSQKIKSEAPANKASDLNTAIGWLLQRPLEDLPDRIVSSAQELRSGINEGMIKTIHVWYVHNLPESKNVKQELLTVESTGSAAIANCFPEKKVVIHTLEVGQRTLGEWYSDTQSPILVNDDFDVDINNGFEISGPGWKAFVAAIPTRFLYRCYKKYKTKLFSANVRDYLGSRSSDSNINNGIKKTAETDSVNFWVFNNGVTILVNNYDTEKSEKTKKLLKINGISIVNGAQTTGAIGSLSKLPSDKGFVQARFVQTENAELIQDIIQYNNSQNKVTASDFRSTDNVQKRLKEQIAKIPDAEYEGGRRGGYGDAITRRPNLMPSYTVGQALAAVHGDPVVAYNQKTKIWVEDKLYAKYFNEDTKGAHLVFTYGLLRAVENRKLYLIERSKKSESSLTTAEEQQLNFFRRRGSTYLLVSALAACIETFISRKIPNLFRISFGETISPKKSQEIWSKIVEVNSPLSIHLDEAFSDGLKSAEKVKTAIQKFQSLVQVTMNANAQIYQEFAAQIAKS